MSRYRVYPKTDQHAVDAGHMHPPTMGRDEAIAAIDLATGRSGLGYYLVNRLVGGKRRKYGNAAAGGVSVLVDLAPTAESDVAA